MTLRSTPHRYGLVAITLHWLTLAVIIALLASGFRADASHHTAAEAALLRVHVPLGLLALALVIARLVWWGVADRKPAPLPAPPVMLGAARVVHWLLYGVVLVLGVSGIGMIALSHAAPLIFGRSGAILPDFDPLPPHGGHVAAVLALLGLVTVHAGAALHHQFVRREAIFARMGLGR